MEMAEALLPTEAFFENKQPSLVAEIEEAGILRVVGAAHEVAAGGADELDILHDAGLVSLKI